MSSHPGSTLWDAVALAVYLKEHGLHPQQVQDFYPTPGTISTCMFYTGLDPFTMQKVYVPKAPREKAMRGAFAVSRSAKLQVGTGGADAGGQNGFDRFFAPVSDQAAK